MATFGNLSSQHFAQHELVGAALGEAFTAEPPFSGRRLATLEQLGEVAQTVYDFALDAGMVALMRRLPAAQLVLKASFQAYVRFSIDFHCFTTVLRLFGD